jgi:DNA-binding MurR/RpiR family transcriptional regulator
MFEERIREYYDSLTPGFRKIADFITSQTLDAAFLTTTELARRVGVDQATVVRFAQAIEYSGYRELSQEIEEYVLKKVTASYRKAAEAETEETLVEGLAENTEQRLRECFATEASKIGEAVHILRDAPHIWVAAEFVMYHLAEYIVHSLQGFQIPASAVHPTTHTSSVALSHMQEGEALLAFTIYFPHVDTGHLVNLAREKGLHTINVTDYSNGLAAREADITIKVSSKSPMVLPSVGPAFNVMQIMAASIIAQRSESSAKAFTNYNDYLGQILELRAETFEKDILSSYLDT